MQKRHRHVPPSVAPALQTESATSQTGWTQLLLNIPSVIYHNPKVVGLIALGICGGIASVMMKHQAQEQNFNPCAKYFDWVGGNVNNFEDAQLYVIGEVHNYKNETLACLKQIKPKTVLVESVALGKQVDCATKEIIGLDNVLCIGWDLSTKEHIKQNKDLGVRYAVMAYLKELHQQYQDGKFDQIKFPDILNKIITKTSKDVKIAESQHGLSQANIKTSIEFTQEEAAYQSNTALLSELNNIKQQLLEKKSVAQIFSVYQPEFAENYFDGNAYYDPNDPTVVAQMQARNQHLIQGIIDYQTPGEKIVVVCGKNHFMKRSYPVGTDVAVDAVQKFLLTRNYYAVLASKYSDSQPRVPTDKKMRKGH